MTYEVAGWSGSLVPRGAGIKPALLRDPATGRYASAADAPADTRAWHTEAEVAAFAQRGLLTLHDLHAHAIPDGVVLYASREFVERGHPDRVILDPTPLTLHTLAPASLVWAGYMPLGDAARILAAWGTHLLDDADAQLTQRTEDPDRRLAAARALDDAIRARFCVTPQGHPELRYELFRMMAIAARVLGQLREPIYLDAAIDLTPSRLEQLQRDVESFSPRPRASVPADLPVLPGRRGQRPRSSVPVHASAQVP